VSVYSIEIALLLATLVAMFPLLRRETPRQQAQTI
jgi:hypothetical protein